MIRAVLFILLCVMAAAPAAAQDCAGAEDQASMDECAGREFKAADAALNRAYKSITRRLADDEDTRKLFVTAQKAWIEFRDAECNFSTNAASGGSIHAMLVTSCLTALTKKRTEDFGRYLNCEEGDLSCPVPAE